MKKVLAILLCLCLTIIPVNVTALDSLEAVVTDDTVTETPIENGGITITPSGNTPEEQAIQKIIAHKRALGEDVSAETMAQAQGLEDGGIYYIKNYFSGKYLNVHYGVDANGTNVYQWTGDSSTEQKFKIVYHSSTDSYKIYAMCSSNGTNRVLDVVRNGAALASGQNVDIWTPVDHTAQRMKFTYLTYDIYHIRMNANTNMYLTSYGNSNGTSGGKTATSAGNVFIQFFDVNDNQQWQFIKIGSSPSNPDPEPNPEPEPEPEPEPDPDPSTSLTINIAERATLTEGAEHIYTFTPTTTGTYVVQTTGNTDTYGTVNININGTIITETNDDSGEGINFNIMFYATAGKTVEIKVRHYNASSGTGSYNIKVHRARAQIYTFDYGFADINTTADKNIPLSGFPQLGYETTSNINAEVVHATSTNTNGFANFNSEVVFFSGHGGSLPDYQTCLCFFNGEILDYDNLTSRNLPQDMNNVRVALWSACYSGQQVNENGYEIYSIAESAYDKGAKASIGWTTEIDNDAANIWNNVFLYYLCMGNDVEMSMVYANNKFDYSDTMITSQIVFGNTGVCIEPNTFIGSVDMSEFTNQINSYGVNSTGEYVQKSLPFGVTRYVRVINGLETNDYFDITNDGTILYSDNHFTDEDIESIASLETSININTTSETLSLVAADNYRDAYYKIGGTVKYIRIINNGDKTLYIDLFNGNEILPERVYSVSTFVE